METDKFDELLEKPLPMGLLICRWVGMGLIFCSLLIILLKNKIPLIRWGESALNYSALANLFLLVGAGIFVVYVVGKALYQWQNRKA